MWHRDGVTSKASGTRSREMRTIERAANSVWEWSCWQNEEEEKAQKSARVFHVFPRLGGFFRVQEDPKDCSDCDGYLIARGSAVIFASSQDATGLSLDV